MLGNTPMRSWFVAFLAVAAFFASPVRGEAMETAAPEEPLLDGFRAIQLSLAGNLTLLESESLAFICDQESSKGEQDPSWSALCKEWMATGTFSARIWEILEQSYCGPFMHEALVGFCRLNLARISVVEALCENASQNSIVCSAALHRMFAQPLPLAELQDMCRLRYAVACFRVLFQPEPSSSAKAEAADNLCGVRPDQLILLNGYTSDNAAEEKFSILKTFSSFERLRSAREKLCLHHVRLLAKKKQHLKAAQLLASTCSVIATPECSQVAVELARELPQGYSQTLSCHGLSLEACRAVAYVLSFGRATSRMALAALEAQCDEMRDALACEWRVARSAALFGKEPSEYPTEEKLRLTLKRCTTGSLFECIKLSALFKVGDERWPPSGYMSHACRAQGQYLCLLVIQMIESKIGTKARSALSPKTIDWMCSRFPRDEFCVSWLAPARELTGASGKTESGE